MSSAGYDYTVSSCCVGELVRAGKRAARLERLFSELAGDPFRRGDYQEEDAQGRTLEVLLEDEWLVTYWTDHAVKLVHILALQRVG